MHNMYAHIRYKPTVAVYVHGMFQPVFWNQRERLKLLHLCMSFMLQHTIFSSVINKPWYNPPV